MKRGVALITAMIVLVLVLMIGGTLLYIGLNAYRTYRSSARVENTMSAAEAGVNSGIIEITNNTLSGTGVSDTFKIDLGRYKSKVILKPLYVQSMYGTGTEFSSGYEPTGSGISGGGASSFYLIKANATGPRKEKVNLEAVYRKVTISSQ